MSGILVVEKTAMEGAAMGKGRRREAARAAEAARVEAWRSENKSTSASTGDDAGLKLSDNDLIKVAKKKIVASPGDKSVTSRGEMRTRFMLDIVLVVVTVAAAAEGVNQTIGITESSFDVPLYGKIGAIVAFVALAVFFGLRAREWKSKL